MNTIPSNLPLTHTGALTAMILAGLWLTSAGSAQASAVYSAGMLPGDPATAGASSLSQLGPVQTTSVSTKTLLTTLYDGSTLFTGVNFTQFEFNVPAAGNLQISLVDLVFPVATGALSFALVDRGRVVDVLPSAGFLDTEIGGPGQFFAYVFAVGAPGVDVGSFHLSIRLQQDQPVPLPASLLLLLSGAAWAGWVGRRNAKKSGDQSLS